MLIGYTQPSPPDIWWTSNILIWIFVINLIIRVDGCKVAGSQAERAMWFLKYISHRKTVMAITGRICQRQRMVQIKWLPVTVASLLWLSEIFDHCARLLLGFPPSTCKVEVLNKRRQYKDQSFRFQSVYKNQLMTPQKTHARSSSMPSMRCSIMSRSPVCQEPSYNLRRSYLIVIPSFWTNVMKSSIAYKGPILRNHLP